MSMGLLDEIYDDAVLAAERSLHHLSAIAPRSIADAKCMPNGLSMGAGPLDLTTAQHLVDAASDSDDFKEGPKSLRRKGLRDFAASENGRAEEETSLGGRAR
jgi:hypothetical protein